MNESKKIILETPDEEHNESIVPENKHFVSACTPNDKAKQHEMKLVTASFTTVEFQKMEQRNDFYVQVLF